MVISTFHVKTIDATMRQVKIYTKDMRCMFQTIFVF